MKVCDVKVLKNVEKRIAKKIHKIDRFSILGKIGIVVIFIMIISGLISIIVMGDNYRIPSGLSLEAPSFSHLLGTDDLGIDLLGQICHGAIISILVGFFSAALAGIGGGILGILSGYYRGWVDKLVMGICDTLMVIPHLPLMIVLGAFFGSSLRNIILVIAILSWSRPARIARSKVLSVRNERYIIAAQSYGAGFFHLLYKHFLPEVLPIMMVSVIRTVSHAIRTEASLSFLGLGDPTSRSWGIILNHSLNFKGIYFTDYWKWWVMSPLIALTLLVVSIAFVSRDIEKIVNKKL